jgi:hypothetical protein
MGFADTPIDVSVDVSFPGSDWAGRRDDTIVGGEARVRFYEQAPLLGINFNKELGPDTKGSGNQFTVKAVPYFFSTEDITDDALIYTWKVNNRDVLPGLDPTILTLSKAGSDEEQLKEQQFTASLRIQTPRHLLQEGSDMTLVTLPEETQ